MKNLNVDEYAASDRGVIDTTVALGKNDTLMTNAGEKIVKSPHVGEIPTGSSEGLERDPQVLRPPSCSRRDRTEEIVNTVDSRAPNTKRFFENYFFHSRKSPFKPYNHRKKKKDYEPVATVRGGEIPTGSSEGLERDPQVLRPPSCSQRDRTVRDIKPRFCMCKEHLQQAQEANLNLSRELLNDDDDQKTTSVVGISLEQQQQQTLCFDEGKTGKSLLGVPHRALDEIARSRDQVENNIVNPYNEAVGLAALADRIKPPETTNDVCNNKFSSNRNIAAECKCCLFDVHKKILTNVVNSGVVVDLGVINKLAKYLNKSQSTVHSFMQTIRNGNSFLEAENWLNDNFKRINEGLRCDLLYKMYTDQCKDNAAVLNIGEFEKTVCSLFTTKKRQKSQRGVFRYYYFDIEPKSLQAAEF